MLTLVKRTKLRGPHAVERAEGAGQKDIRACQLSFLQKAMSYLGRQCRESTTREAHKQAGRPQTH